MLSSTPVRAAAALAFTACAGIGPAQAAEFATVVSSTPVTVQLAVPRQVCNDGQQFVQQRPSGAGALIGAIAGGVIGHNLGNGFGRAAATGLGAVAGAVVGDQVEAANSPVSVVPMRQCQNVASYEDRIVGYDVMYDYAGQRYSTRMARDPGRQFAVSVQPADNGMLPAPLDAGRQGTPVPSSMAAVVSAPQAVYYEQPAPSYYYAPSPVYIAPMIGFGIGYYGGYWGGHRGRHWR